jgi:hypothetical protein
MKFFSILFIFFTFYYLLNRDHLLNSPENRVYKSKFHVYLDLLYFSTDFLYLVWLVILLFLNIKFALLFFTILIMRWLTFDRFKEKIDYAFNVMKILILIAYYFIG